jgi:hypothetical protein
MGTDNFTHTAADARFRIKLQGRHILEISEILHYETPYYPRSTYVLLQTFYGLSRPG